MTHPPQDTAGEHRPAAVAGPVTKVAAPVLVALFAGAVTALFVYAATFSPPLAGVAAAAAGTAGAALGHWSVRTGKVGTPRNLRRDSLADAGVHSCDAAWGVRGSWHPADGGPPRPLEGVLVLTGGSLVLVGPDSAPVTLAGPGATVHLSEPGRYWTPGRIALGAVLLVAELASTGSGMWASSDRPPVLLSVWSDSGTAVLWVCDQYPGIGLTAVGTPVPDGGYRTQMAAAALAAWPQYRWHRDRVRTARA